MQTAEALPETAETLAQISSSITIKATPLILPPMMPSMTMDSGPSTSETNGLSTGRERHSPQSTAPPGPNGMTNSEELVPKHVHVVEADEGFMDISTSTSTQTTVETHRFTITPKSLLSKASARKRQSASKSPHAIAVFCPHPADDQFSVREVFTAFSFLHHSSESGNSQGFAPSDRCAVCTKRLGVRATMQCDDCHGMSEARESFPAVSNFLVPYSGRASQMLLSHAGRLRNASRTDGRRRYRGSRELKLADPQIRRFADPRLRPGEISGFLPRIHVRAVVATGPRDFSGQDLFQFVYKLWTFDKFFVARSSIRTVKRCGPDQHKEHAYAP
jgi:hypothetical protein